MHQFLRGEMESPWTLATVYFYDEHSDTVLFASPKLIPIRISCLNRQKVVYDPFPILDFIYRMSRRLRS